MNRQLKWALYSGVAVLSLMLVVAVAGILVITYTDFSGYRETVEKKMTERLGQNVSIKGDFDVDIGFHTSLKLSDVVIDNAKWGKQPNAVEIDEFFIRVSLLSLLGRTVIDEITLKNAEISLETKDGKSNLGGDEPKQESKSLSVKEIFDSIPIIANADIAATNIHLIDHDNNAHRQVRIASIATKDAGGGAEMSVNISNMLHNGESLGNLTAEVALSRKSLVVRSLRQGKGLRGTLEYKANSQFRTDLDLKGFRLEAVDILLGNKLQTRGAVDGKIKLRGEGSSTKRILSNLEGNINLSSGQVIFGKRLPFLDLVELTNLSSDVRGCVLLRAPVNGGVVSLDAATSSTNIGTVKANGSVDLAKEKLDVIANLNLSLPPILAAKGNVIVTGNLDNPKVNQDNLSLNVDVQGIGDAVEGAADTVKDVGESVFGLLGNLLNNSGESSSSAKKHDTSLAKCRSLAQS